MHKLPPITYEYEPELLDEYTDIYFDLKQVDSDPFYNHYSFYNCCIRNRRRYPNQICDCKLREKRIDSQRKRMKHIQKICFNHLDSIIPPYFLTAISRSPKGRKEISKAYTKHIIRQIEESIDCDLMDCKNIARIICSYMNEEYMYAIHKLFDRNVCILFTIKTTTKLDYTEGGWSVLPFGEKSYTWESFGYPQIIKAEEYSVLDGKLICFPINIKLHNNKKCGFRQCCVCEYLKKYAVYTIYTNKNALLQYIHNYIL